VDYPTVDDRSVMNLKSRDRLKQEVKCNRIIDFIRISYTVRVPPDVPKQVAIWLINNF
jgi:hypothetical protein